ncbi:MAG: PD-(D/E)XK nuclease family protein [Clostridia bacterium]|nr:PD-(D/E)XK nuclease family protein [Clostridia bacterium]
MIEFIYGDHRTGKTERIFSRLLEDAKAGRRSFLIVPEQAAVATEKKALGYLPESAQLTFEVLNFSRMCNRVFREYGGLTYTSLTPGMRLVLMMRALKQTGPLMEEYREAAMNDPTFPGMMLAAVRELRAAGLGAEKIEEFIKTADPRLASKLKDIASCAAVYESLAAGASDTESEFDRLASCLEEHPFFAGSNIYIDSFSSLTGQQHRIVKLLFSQAENCTLSIPLPGPGFNGADTLSIRRMSDRLRADAAASGRKNRTVVIETAPGERTDLERISGALLGFRPVGGERDGSVLLVETENIFDESEFAAGLVKKLMEEGVRAGDILIAARDPSVYRGIIDLSLEDAGVPFWIDDKQSLLHTSPARLVLSALRIIRFGWRRDDVTSHLRTGLCGVGPEDADVFVSYVEKWKISGKGFTSGDWTMNPAGYNSELTEDGKNRILTANRVRKQLCDTIGRLSEEISQAGDCAGICRAIYDFTERLGIRDRLLSDASAALEAGRRQEATLLASSLSSFREALRELAAGYAGEKPETPELINAAEAVFDSRCIGSIPSSSDAVSIAPADMLRADSPRCVLLLGVGDGSFPANPPSGGLLTNDDRLALSSAEGAVISDRASRATDEQYFFRRACAAASDKLFIFRRHSDSVIINRIKKIYPGIETILSSDRADIRLASEVTAADWLPLIGNTPAGKAVSEILPDAGTSPVKLTSEEASVSPDTVEFALGRDLMLSASQIKTFSDCPFKYLCSRMLRLNDQSPAVFSYDSYGSLIHSALEKYLADVFTRRGGVFPAEPGEDKKLISDSVAAAAAEIAPEGSAERTALLSHISERSETTAEIIIRDLRREIEDSDLKPAYFELNIGRGGIKPLSFPLSDGSRVSLTGRIDRVDTGEKDGRTYVRAVDYKTSSGLPGRSSAEYFQLPLYLLSLLEEGKGERFSNEPEAAGFEYIGCGYDAPGESFDDKDAAIEAASQTIRRSGFVAEGAESVVSRSNDPKYTFEKSGRRSQPVKGTLGDIEREAEALLCGAAEAIKTGIAAARPAGGKDTCKKCPYKAVCRSSAAIRGRVLPESETGEEGKE